MPPISAGLLMYRFAAEPQVLLGHPGGPFYQKKDAGHWSIPKGLVDAEEDLLIAAKREFGEETGIIIETDQFISLDSVKYKNGKVLYAWAFEGEWDPKLGIVSNTFELEWPPKSGTIQAFPEIDRAAWFGFSIAKDKILRTQLPFVMRLQEALAKK